MENGKAKLDPKDFDALIKKWMHHDRLLNERERSYYVTHALLATVSTFVYIQVGPLLAGIILIAFPWVMLSYYKKAQAIDRFFRNSFDFRMAEYVWEQLLSYSSIRPDGNADESWARAFRSVELTTENWTNVNFLERFSDERTGMNDARVTLEKHRVYIARYIVWFESVVGALAIFQALLQYQTHA